MCVGIKSLLGLHYYNQLTCEEEEVFFTWVYDSICCYRFCKILVTTHLSHSDRKRPPLHIFYYFVIYLTNELTYFTIGLTANTSSYKGSLFENGY